MSPILTSLLILSGIVIIVIVIKKKPSSSKNVSQLYTMQNGQIKPLSVSQSTINSCNKLCDYEGKRGYISNVEECKQNCYFNTPDIPNYDPYINVPGGTN